jgi:hypothetical protein
VLGSRLSGKGTRPSYQIFQGTVLQWRRCVRPCTSARPLVAKRGGFGGDLAVLSIGT